MGERADSIADAIVISKSIDHKAETGYSISTSIPFTQSHYRRPGASIPLLTLLDVANIHSHVFRFSQPWRHSNTVAAPRSQPPDLAR